MKKPSLRDIRKERNMSITFVADTIGISASSISRIENGINTFNIDIARRLAGIYGVSVEDITGPPIRPGRG